MCECVLSSLVLEENPHQISRFFKTLPRDEILRKMGTRSLLILLFFVACNALVSPRFKRQLLWRRIKICYTHFPFQAMPSDEEAVEKGERNERLLQVIQAYFFALWKKNSREKTQDIQKLKLIFSEISRLLVSGRIFMVDKYICSMEIWIAPPRKKNKNNTWQFV